MTIGYCDCLWFVSLSNEHGGGGGGGNGGGGSGGDVGSVGVGGGD